MNTITPITSISESILKYFRRSDGKISIELNEDHLESTVKGLEVIKEQGSDLMDFVQSYRSFLSIPKPDKSLVGVKQLLDKVRVLMDQEVENGGIDFKVIVEPDNLELFIDEKQISQILINLTKNALQSLRDEKEGKIIVAAGSTQTGKNYIKVLDNGPGIPADLIDEIFVPFFTTKDTGTGIGLSLSKQIMHLHGGTMKVHSVPFEQTTFLLVF